MSYFPPLEDSTIWALGVIQTHLQEDPADLDHPERPYTDEEAAFLTQLLGPELVSDPNFEGEGKWARLERESSDLFKSLTDTGKELAAGDNAEKMAYFRTATSLLEKIVGIQERTANLRAISRFHDTVLAVMEDILTPDQRTAVMERLKASIQPEESN
jgi:hypothetical protein